MHLQKLIGYIMIFINLKLRRDADTITYKLSTREILFLSSEQQIHVRITRYCTFPAPYVGAAR